MLKRTPHELARMLRKSPGQLDFETMREAGELMHIALDALDHIAKTAAAARTPTRRIRWIEQRALKAHAGEIYDELAVHLPEKVDRQVDRLKRKVARAIHWPACWDTAAYPTEMSALDEVGAAFQCTNHQPDHPTPT